MQKTEKKLSMVSGSPAKSLYNTAYFGESVSAVL